MNSRQLEEAYQKEVERITQKVHLGEISHDDGEFLIMLARERSRRNINRLKRPSRMIYYVLGFAALAGFLYCFYAMYLTLVQARFSQIFLYGIGISTGVLVVLFFFELKRMEKMFSRFFSKQYFKKILYAPEVEFEYRRIPMIQVRLQIKNENNLYAGLKDEEVFELRSNILATVANCLDDGKGILEQVGENDFVVDYFLGDDTNSTYVLRKISKLFDELRLMDGQWFSKSLRMGASIVLGEYLVGNLGHDYQVFRSFGKKTSIAQSLCSATGWEEIYMDDTTLGDLENAIYSAQQEPVFLRSSGELIKVFKFSGWKDKPGEH